MKIYEFFDEDYNKTVDMAEDIEELAGKLVKCLNKAEEREGNQGGDMNFRRSPRMRGGRGGGQGSYNMPRMRGGIGGYTDVPPHMRGYVVRPEDEDWMYNERYNW